MNTDVQIITVDATNVAQHRFFCFKSKPKSEGYRRKLDWLEARFSEGLIIKIVRENGRHVGFIEYIPGEFAWRVVEAKGYMVIHCLWVVGKAKGKGYGSRLVKECVADACNMHMHGVAMVTSSRTWLAGKKLFLRNGFESVDQTPPSFELLVKRFDAAPPPAFPQDWAARLERYGPGLTVIRSDQCPYLDRGTRVILETARELGIPARAVELHNCREVQDSAPSAYGVFNVVYDGKLLTYHYEGKNGFLKLLEKGPNQ